MPIRDWRVATVVDRGASLGAGAVIGPGVRIGEFAMVGAGAVVTRDVPAYRLVVGNPARPIGWVCACGGRLCTTLACRSCGTIYRLSDQEAPRSLRSADPDPVGPGKSARIQCRRSSPFATAGPQPANRATRSSLRFDRKTRLSAQSLDMQIIT